MDKYPVDFDRLAREALLDPAQKEHFVRGMTEGAEDLHLHRVYYIRLQALLEEALLSTLPMPVQPDPTEAKPFAYATPAPLSPHNPSNPRHSLIRILFYNLKGISVMNDHMFRMAVREAPVVKDNLASLARRGLAKGADLFSTSPEKVSPPRMTLHWERDDGPIRVAFVAEQIPSTAAGRLVFGDEATAMYQEVVAMHEANIQAGRGAEYVASTRV